MKYVILKNAVVKPKKPVHLVLHVTNICNFRCKHCFVDFSKKVTDLTIEEIEKISKYLGRFIWLDIGGGEPMLRKDLGDIVGMFDMKAVSVPTNGYYPDNTIKITRDIRNKTKSEVTICASVDGFKESNDFIRNDKSWDRVVETIKDLKKIDNINLKINTVLVNKNYDEIIEFMKFVKSEWNPTFHSIIVRRGDPVPFDFERPSVEKLIALKNSVFLMWKKYKIRTGIESLILENYKHLVYEAAIDVLSSEKQIPPCLAGTHHLVIYAQGDLSFCETLPPFGNIRENSIETILNSDHSNIGRKDIRDGKCYCYHNCNLVENYFLSPKQYPKLFKPLMLG